MEKQIEKSAEGGYGWLVAGSAFIIRVLMDGLVCSFGVMAVPLITDFGASRQLVGWTGSLLAGTSLCIGPIANWACTYFGCRKVVISGTVAAVFGMLISSFATEPWILIVTYGFIVGVGSCFVLLPTIVCVAYYFDRRRALVLGLTSCGSGLGVFLMGYLSEFLVLRYGWSGTMLIESGLLLNCCAFGLIIVEPQVQPFKQRRGQNSNHSAVDAGIVVTSDSCKPVSDGNKTELQQSPSAVQFTSEGEKQDFVNNATISSNLSEFKLIDLAADDNVSEFKTKKNCAGFHIFYNAPFTLFMTTSLVTCLGTFVPYLFLADRAYNLDYSLEHSASLILMIGVVNIIGRIAGGVLGDRKFVNRLALLTGCVTVCGIAICCVAVRFAYWFLALCAIIFGFCMGVVVGLLPVVLVDLVSLAQLSCAYGISGLFSGIGFIFGPPLAGLLFDTTDSYEVTFVVTGLVVVIGSLCNIAIFFMPSYRQSTK